MNPVIPNFIIIQTNIHNNSFYPEIVSYRFNKEISKQRFLILKI